MLTLAEISEGMKNLKDWTLETDSISKIFTFDRFNGATQFVNRVASIAEKLDHHPDIFWQGCAIKITSRTHSEKGISKRDFALAKEIDALDEENPSS